MTTGQLVNLVVFGGIALAIAFLLGLWWGYEWGHKRGWAAREGVRVSRKTVERLKQWEVDDGGA